jgi:hypothetical protein
MGQYPQILHPPHPREQGSGARNGLPRQEVIDRLRGEPEAAKGYAPAGPVEKGGRPLLMVAKPWGSPETPPMSMHG